RRSDLARGIVILRSTRPLDAAEQKQLWDALSTAGVTEPADEDADDEPARQWHAAPWLPPAFDQVDAQRVALEATAERFAIDAAWCVKVETGIDGVAWLEIAASEPAESEDEDVEPTEPLEVLAARFDQGPREVLYSAPDAPESEPDDSGGDSDEDD